MRKRNSTKRREPIFSASSQREKPKKGPKKSVKKANPRKRVSKPTQRRAVKQKRRIKKRRRSFLGFIFRWFLMLGFLGTIGLGGVIIYFASDLPQISELTIPERPPNIRILARDGSLIANRGETGGESVRLEQLPPYLPQAVIAIEDRRFHSHFGVDPIGLTRAIITNLRAGHAIQGGSTLTQQLAKNLFLKPERTYRRKVQEAILAVWLESKLSKDEIMEMYLNRVFFGAGATGVDAAARVYFQKSARHLTLSEAALIAGLLPAPSVLAPNKNPKGANARARLVLQAMQDQGYITNEERQYALENPAQAKSRHLSGSENYVADWVMGRTRGFINIFEEDIIVETTIDLPLQRAAEAALRIGLERDGETFGVSQGALIAIDPTGAVRALVGGRNYSESEFNRAINARRQPGSSFKPFVYLAAIELGLTPDTVRIDGPVQIRGWQPRNYNHKYQGPVTLEQALALSLNTVAARLGEEVGIDAVVEVANRLGINSELQRIPSLALGTSETTPLEMTAAYVPFANGGFGVIEHVIERITTVSGEVIYERQPSGGWRVMTPYALGLMNSMLEKTVAIGTGKKAQLARHPVAGKTGTSQDFRDAWFIGYSANLVAGIWLGNDDNRPTKRASGGNLPATIWHDFMTVAHQNAPALSLPGATESREILSRQGAQAQPFARSQAEIDRSTGQKRGFFRRLFGN